MPTTLSSRPDAACAAAVELAADAARDVAGADAVGEHLGVRAEGDRVVTHSFASRQPGYAGWTWAVTVARAPRAKLVTVDEVVLLPGEGALLPPEWVPWSERLRPGDLGVGDLLPTPADDDRLAPAYVESDDPAVEEVAFELGVGRVRVMSRLGREETAERWYEGEAGPDTPLAVHAPGRCGTCGFFLPVAGSLRGVFGVCGNGFSPRDGRVVAVDAGCGAHSEALVEPPPVSTPPPPAWDDDVLEVEARTRALSDDEAESLGHS
ncbi:MAG TPA: DUF3027 domain-containing protein [Mycobacteriales bacterium]